MSAMRELAVDLWASDPPVDARCITTNNALRRNGTAICGAGCAKEAVARYPEIEAVLGLLIRENGPVLHVVDDGGLDDRTLAWDPPLIAFPVKHHWRARADLDLIVQSATTLATLIDDRGWTDVWLPRPGCGLGGLDWDRDVRPALEPILDDRVVIIDFPAQRAAPGRP